MRKLKFEYYQSDMCPALLFNCEQDALQFEAALNKFINSDEGKEDWFAAETKYPSSDAVTLAIHRSEFHFHLQSQLAENLILAAENAVDMNECGNIEGDIYYPVMMYCWHTFHQKYGI